MSDSPLRSESGVDERRPAGEPSFRRLLPLLAPVIAAGASTLAVAAWSFVAGPPSGATIAGVSLMLAAAALAEAYPVPIESLAGGHVSLAAVFVVATGLLYGWPAARAMMPRRLRGRANASTTVWRRRF